MVAFAIPWAAMGIGALMGGLTSKQRGGNFLKGALQGAALGGITGGIGGLASGTAAGTSAGGVFGFGSKMIPNFLAMSGIGMGSEMLGQQDANKQRMEQTRRWLDEEEERRIARLSRIAGYDVADSANFMTPNKYFAAEGGLASRPGYLNGGSATLDYTDPDLYTPTGEGGGPGSRPIQQIPLGPGPSFVDEFEDFDYMDASSGGDESGWYEMFFNEFGRPPIDINELQLFIDQSDISPMDVAARGGGQGPMMAAEGGRVHAAKGMFSDKKALDAWKDAGGNVLKEAILRLKENPSLRSGDFNIPSGRSDSWLADYEGPRWSDWYKENEDMYAAHGGSVMGKDEYDEELNRPNMFLGGAMGLGALLGGAGLLSKIFRGRKRGDIKAKIKDRDIKSHIPRPGPLIPDEDELPPHIMPVLGLLNKAEGGITDLDMTNGGASLGPGTGTSDDIPAMLSDGEFVVTANAVKNLGGGDRMLGAQRMYRMMNQLDPNSQTPAEMSGVGYA